MNRTPNRYIEMLVVLRVVDNGSFSAAARNLDLTPSAVSKVIARIESRLGVLLFRRAHREIALTPEGEAYYSAARAAIESVDAVRRCDFQRNGRARNVARALNAHLRASSTCAEASAVLRIAPEVAA